ncbi:MAG: HepT-like ribonuclease domain-containing protein [Bacteroidia bacterium]
MSKEALEYLRHIDGECTFILSVSDPELTYERFIQDETLKRAIVRSLEIIGEASKKIPADKKLKWNSIEWKSIAGMRARLIHEHMGINYLIVWDVVKNKILLLKDQIDHFLKG